MNKTKVKFEKMKTYLLVVLFLMTILLLYFLWYGKPSNKFEFTKSTELLGAVDISSVIVPQEVLISKGGNDFVQSPQNRSILWNDYILTEIKKACMAGSMVTEEITKEQYEKVTADNSVIARFSYTMPFEGFCKMFEIKEFQGVDKIEPFSEIGFSMSSPESLFVSDALKDKYYRLIGNFKTDVPQRLKNIANEEEYPTYYKLSTLTGTESKYDVFVPIDAPKALPELSLSRGLSEITEREHDKIAERYFGNSFDFVRKVKENDGTLVYMYGYGKITLTIDPALDILEYKSDSSQTVSQTEFQALSTALLFAGQKQCFQTASGERIPTVLKSITPINETTPSENKKMGYRFEFTMLANGHEIFSYKQPEIVIEVTNGGVTYFSKTLSSKFTQSSSKFKETIQPIDIIVENHELLAIALAEKGKESKNSFDDVTHEIKSMQYGYLRHENILLPVWEIGLSTNVVLYFDPFTGKEVE